MWSQNNLTAAPATEVVDQCRKSAIILRRLPMHGDALRKLASASYYPATPNARC